MLEQGKGRQCGCIMLLRAQEAEGLRLPTCGHHKACLEMTCAFVSCACARKRLPRYPRT